MRRAIGVALVGVCLGLAPQAAAQDLVVRTNHNAVLRSEADTVAILRKGRAAGFRPSVLFGRVVTFRLTLGQMNAFSDSARRWPEFARTPEGRLMIDWDGAVDLPPDSTEAVAAPLDNEPTWSVVAVSAPTAWALGYDGAGIRVAALDAAGGFSNPNIAPNIAGGWNATTGDTANGYQVDGNCNSHGAHTFSSMVGTRASGVGVAPGGTGLQIRVFEFGAGFGCTAYTSSTLRGARYAADHGARILNVSIGHGSSFSGDAVVSDLKARGVLFCGANGNSGAYGTSWPAQNPDAAGSAAVDAAGNRASWSNYGPTTDVGSPGVNVLGALEGTGLGTKSGTSMASPTTCGVLALAMQAAPGVPTDTLLAALRATADSLPGARPNDFTGWGRPNAAKAIAYLKGGVATSWTSRTYPALTVATDSVLAVCVQSCQITATGNVGNVSQLGGYVRFTATGTGTISIRSVSQ